MASDQALRIKRAQDLATADLSTGQRRLDTEIAEELGVSQSTLCRIRKTEEYQEAVDELTAIDPVVVARIRQKITTYFENLLDLLDRKDKKDAASLSEATAAVKMLASLRPQIVSQEPSTQLALPLQDLHPATVLIQHAYFGQQQGEVVEGQAKVLPIRVESPNDGQ